MINEKNRFSVLAIPDTLKFYLNDEEGCKQEIKIYNVHDFTINFKVLCTSVDNYSVNPATGSVRAGHHIDIQIYLKNHDFDRKKDIFKIDACSKENNKIVGEKEIIAHILPEKALEERTTKRNNDELRAAKSDENNSNNRPKNNTIQLDDLQNVVLITTNRFFVYIFIVFMIGVITGMVLNAPQDLNQINLD